MKLANITQGEMFVYDGALFVVAPFDWEKWVYLNICVASRNENYCVGETYVFDSSTETTYITRAVLKDFIPKI